MSLAADTLECFERTEIHLLYAPNLKVILGQPLSIDGKHRKAAWSLLMAVLLCCIPAVSSMLLQGCK